METSCALPTGTLTFPVHGHRGLDAAAEGARAGGLPRAARDPLPGDSVGDRAKRRNRGRSGGRLVACRLPQHRSCDRDSGRDPVGARGATLARGAHVAVRMGMHTGEVTPARRPTSASPSMRPHGWASQPKLRRSCSAPRRRASCGRTFPSQALCAISANAASVGPAPRATLRA